MDLHQSVGKPALPPFTVGNYRWSICALLFFGTAINYIDRQILGVLGPSLQKELHWSEGSYANIVSVFQLAYAFGYLFGGRLMDYFGIKRGYPGAAFIWSIAAAAHGLAKTVLSFGVARFVLGGAEGCNFPAAIRVVTEWFPVNERAFATGLFNSAAGVGTIICPLVVPFLAHAYGWQFAFLITGGLGLIWVCAWMLLYDPPDTHPKVSDRERAYIEQGRIVEEDFQISLGKLLCTRSSWAYIIPNAMTSMVWWFYIFWFPKFITRNFRYDPVMTGYFTAIMYSISILGSIGAGYLSGFLINRGWSVDKARKTALLVPAICALPVCFAPYTSSVWTAVALVGLAAAGHQGFSANLYTLASDIVPKKVIGSLVGLGGFAAGMASIALSQLVGVILTRTSSYATIFMIAAPMYVAAVLVIQLLVPNIDRQKQTATA
jgi:ACS family hexuronate transporter-like MFS transporter